MRCCRGRDTRIPLFRSSSRWRLARARNSAALCRKSTGWIFTWNPFSACLSWWISLHFSRNSVWPGNANLPIGDLQYANREIGVPRLQTMQCVISVRCDWDAIPIESSRKDGLSGRWPCAVLVNWREMRIRIAAEFGYCFGVITDRPGSMRPARREKCRYRVCISKIDVSVISELPGNSHSRPIHDRPHS